jgi:hypothetical protein
MISVYKPSRDTIPLNVLRSKENIQILSLYYIIIFALNVYFRYFSLKFRALLPNIKKEDAYFQCIFLPENPAIDSFQHQIQAFAVACL